MLFDLRARGRRRTVKIVYVFLALLMGGGLGAILVIRHLRTKKK